MMRPVSELADELARFDINLAPLEPGNVFCEAKSELKFFEAALVDVPTIASPSGPFCRCIRDGETGFLADCEPEWYDRLTTLVADPGLRRRMGHAAYLSACWTFGPRRREEQVAALLRHLSGDAASSAQAFELEMLRQSAHPQKCPDIPDSDVLFRHDRLETAEVTVVVPLFNY